jgi:hypothetical protein
MGSGCLRGVAKAKEDDQPLVAALEAMYGKGRGSALHIYLLWWRNTMSKADGVCPLAGYCRN